MSHEHRVLVPHQTSTSTAVAGQQLGRQQQHHGHYAHQHQVPVSSAPSGMCSLPRHSSVVTTPLYPHHHNHHPQQQQQQVALRSPSQQAMQSIAPPPPPPPPPPHQVVLRQQHQPLPPSSAQQWTAVDQLATGPLNPLCITDAGHEILRPKPRRPSSSTASKPVGITAGPIAVPPSNNNYRHDPISTTPTASSAAIAATSPAALSPTTPTSHSRLQTATPATTTIKSNPEFSPASPQPSPHPVAAAAGVHTSHSTDCMVSAKRKSDYFPQLYVANNIKTSSYSDQATSSSGGGGGGKTGKSGTAAVNVVRLSGHMTAAGAGTTTDVDRLERSHHISSQDLRLHRPPQQQLHYRHQHHNCNSSSDENRSSGHASMSDTGGHSSPRDGGPSSAGPGHGGYHHFASSAASAAGPSSNQIPALSGASLVPKSVRARMSTHQYNRARHRATPAKLQVPWTGSGGLEDIKLALQQLTLRSHTSVSTYSSLSAGSESSEPAMRRLMRHSSLETINTNITSADEFVWVDSHNRLVELQHLPWTNHCVLRMLQTGRCREQLPRVSVDAIPRLSYLGQRALVRIARETQRLAATLAVCTKHDVTAAFRVVLCPPLADGCVKACMRAAAMLSMSGGGGGEWCGGLGGGGGVGRRPPRQGKSARAGLQLHVGRFHRWMVDVKLARFVHEYAAVYLCAGIENLLEEILLQSLPNDEVTLTATLLEHAIANNGDFWGLLQPYAHLNAGRIASGALALPRWTSVSSVGSGRDSGRGSGGLGLSSPSTISSSSTPHINNCLSLNGSAEPSALMTTCVGSLRELQDLLGRMQPRLPLCPRSVRTLFYFMRCSQLEHGSAGNGNAASAVNSIGGVLNGSGGNTPANAGAPGLGGVAGSANAGATPNTSNAIQELCYERAYVVLPPLVEWIRVATAHGEHRYAAVLDKDDIMQAARLLLPGVDCPVRALGEESIRIKRITGGEDDHLEASRQIQIELAFRLMLTGRMELIQQALNLLPPSTRLDTMDQQGHTALMLAALYNDDVTLLALLEAGAGVDVETPPQSAPHFTAVNSETVHWTALTYAAARGHVRCARMLMERGASVEGGAQLSEDKCTLTPLQVACGSGHMDTVCLLLGHGAHPFLATQIKDSLCYSASSQRGCYSPISVAAAHGHRAVLQKLLAQPVAAVNREVLSLEEMLAEGTASNRGGSPNHLNGSSQAVQQFSKAQVKALQEAMYHSAENNHLDITIEIRSLGIPWTLHCWMHSLGAAHESRLDCVIDQLLQDFLQVCPDDHGGTQFVQECLPLLFNIFRYSKKEGTTLLLADIFSTCFGWESIASIGDTSTNGNVSGSRIDPTYVNNPELSDVTFRVEGRLFYAHKIVLVTASARLRAMLSSKLCESGPPTVQINDIRYHIFQIVMQFLYQGGCQTLEPAPEDILELMAAANFFQLDGLLRYCESRCAAMLALDNVVSMYIHAKVYNAIQLLEYCQGFLLQNMVALLTYDDSVKRLLFAKKLPNHDVLAALLVTLQNRIKSRRGSQTNAGPKIGK